MKHTYFEIWLIIGLIIALAVLLLTQGCSYNECTETVDILCGDEVVAQYKSGVSQTLLLYFTKTKQIERTTPLSSLFIGDIESAPDPNAIGSMGGAIGEGLRALILE